MKSFCPAPQHFAVMQMDPVGMVKQYHDDPIALAQARAMRPKKYLVYLLLIMELPTPTKPWFRYEVWPVATTLRPEDKDKGITPDMVVPISPNTSHPHGRAPVPTETPFPFPNCYFWIDASVVVRVRRKAIRYDYSRAPALSALEDIRLQGRFVEDYERMNAFRREREEAMDRVLSIENLAAYHSAPSPCPHDFIESHSSASDAVSLFDNDNNSLPDHHERPSDDEEASTVPSDSVEAGSTADPEIAAIFKMDYFSSNDDDTIELIPLVDLWFDVAEQLSSETIPSPLDFHKEQAEIMRIIHDARERASSPRWPLTEPPVPIDFDALSYYKPSSETDNDRKRAQTSPLGTISRAWRKLRCAAERVLTARIPWRVRPPCLPFWP
ncbi:hypothetical protein C8Q77DRAFT_291612 [Trametes polyzona]|nr:hypothetical protein C8Q77DRAFT_291612 [Trametes polyzona]